MNYSPNKYTAEQVLQPCNTMHEMMIMNDPYACINGLLYIADLGNASANHVLQYTPSIMKRQATHCEKALPIRIKGIIFINVSTVAEQFCKLLMPWLSEKLRKRVSLVPKFDWNIDLNYASYRFLFVAKIYPILANVYP